MQAAISKRKLLLKVVLAIVEEAESGIRQANKTKRQHGRQAKHKF